ncbi:Chitotriosidase-1 [Exaiptasia diaphana]|nr:Chitotriosidase-1 [Exaiptasia diaphana]
MINTTCNYCSGKGNGNYPDPDNCNGYISCVHSRIVKMPCPKGLVWSDSVKRCEWPSKAKPPCRQGCRGNKLSKFSCGVLRSNGECKHSFIRKLCCMSCG